VSALAILRSQAQRAADLVIDSKVGLCLSQQIMHEVLAVLAPALSRDPKELSRTAIFFDGSGRVRNAASQVVRTRRRTG
jgi:hypothetical protein